MTREEQEQMKARLRDLGDRQKTEFDKIPAPKEPANFVRYTHLGLEFILIFLGFMFLGQWLDGLWSTSPLLIILGIALGFAGGMYRLIKVANELSRS